MRPSTGVCRCCSESEVAGWISVPIGVHYLGKDAWRARRPPSFSGALCRSAHGAIVAAIWDDKLDAREFLAHWTTPNQL